ncbi:glycosyltransferase [Chryseolinea sp. H1M3-3]|uniref:glycosyltransferase n=1 Tax=Chryseolinea sp. H1M3-3 TaxID=3034144 RepID=UPI0023ED61A8|nr:glycosyltransferase [Chryseolinea sp. H1M3-3]
MSKKKLLIFHPALAPYRVDQFNAIARLFELHVVFIFDNVWNHKFDQSKLQEKLIFEYSFLLKGPRIKGRVFRFGMVKKIRQVNPEIIIGYEYSFTTLYLILLKKLGIIKQQIGSMIDDSLEISRHIQSGMRDRVRSFSVKHLDYLIVLSDEVADFYQTKFSLDKKRVIVSPLFQDPLRLRKDAGKLVPLAKTHFQKFNLKNKKVLLFVGRFIPEKGLLNFIEIITPILKEDPEVRLVLVGDGTEREKIQGSIEKHGVQNSVVLAGRYEGDELLAWYHCASAFALPSFYEPFGAVVNEALIFGLKVFCSQFAGSSYLTTPGEDALFNPNDIDQSRLALKIFLGHIPVKESIDETLAPVRMRIDYNKVFDGWKKSMYD